MNAAALRRVFTSEDSYGTTLLTYFIDRYAPEGLTWAPMTIRLEIEDDMDAPMPPAVFDRLMAALFVASSDEFYLRLPRFIQICNVLYGSPLLPDVVDPATVRECAWGVTEAALLNPPPEEIDGFHPDIRSYVDRVLSREGFLTTPVALRPLIPNRDAEYAAYPVERPTAFAGEFEAQAESAAEVDAEVSERLRELFEQLEALPLTSGDTKNLIQRFLRR